METKLETERSFLDKTVNDAKYALTKKCSEIKLYLEKAQDNERHHKVSHSEVALIEQDHKQAQHERDHYLMEAQDELNLLTKWQKLSWQGRRKLGQIQRKICDFVNKHPRRAVAIGAVASFGALTLVGWRLSESFQ